MFCSRSAANAPSITPAVVRPGARDFPIPHQQLLERVADVVGAGRQLVPDRVGPGRGGAAPERAAGRPARRDRGSSPSRSRSERLSRGLPSRPSSSTALARAAGASSASRLRMPGRAAARIAIRALARGSAQATADAGDGAAGLEVLGDGLARLAAEGRRELGQDLGERVLVAAVGAAGRLAVEQRVGGGLDAAPRLGPQLVAAMGVHPPGPEQQRVHHADQDHDKRKFEWGRHASATIDTVGLRFAHALT